MLVVCVCSFQDRNLSPQPSTQGIGFMRKGTELDLHGPAAAVGSKAGKKLKDAKANKSLAKAEERKNKRLQRELAVRFIAGTCDTFY